MTGNGAARGRRSLFRRIALNRHGRDFIAGDVHGEAGLLDKALDQVGFEPARDRLFAVGDLIDRGPDSVRVVRLLNEPWFYSVMGNHEAMLLQATVEPPSPHTRTVERVWLSNGGSWYFDLAFADQQRVRRALDTLPLALELESAVGRVGLVHAGPWRNSWVRTREVLTRETGETQELLDACDHLVWSREFARNLLWWDEDGERVDGIDLVFFGHTPQTEPRWFANACCLDTGCSLRHAPGYGRLSLACVSDPDLPVTIVNSRGGFEGVALSPGHR